MHLQYCTYHRLITHKPVQIIYLPYLLFRTIKQQLRANYQFKVLNVQYICLFLETHDFVHVIQRHDSNFGTFL